MKRAIITSLVLIAGLWAVGSASSWAASVDGYWRNNGTYVQPHYRSAPASSRMNNSSVPGNWHPNTGKITPGDPWRELNRDDNFSLRPRRSW